MQCSFITDWFFGKELQFAMGVGSSIPNLFSFVAGYVAPWSYKLGGKGYDGLALAFGIGAVVVGICWCFALCMAFLDKLAERRDKQLNNESQQEEEA